MKSWLMYVQFNGPEVSIFDTVEIEISDKVYNQIQKALKNNIPLKSCEFRYYLYKKAEKAAYAKLIENEDIECPEKPIRDDYDDLDDYKLDMEDYYSALEEYKDEIERIEEDYWLADTTIDDPGDLIRFKERFVGNIYPGFKGVTEEIFEAEAYDELIATYQATVHFDENGTVTDIDSIFAEAMESDDVRGGSYGECYPDYELLAEAIQNGLEDKQN